MISFKFDLYKKGFMERKYTTGSMPLLAPTTVLGHVVGSRLSPLPQYLANVVEKPTRRAGMLHPEDSLQVAMEILKYISFIQYDRNIDTPFNLIQKEEKCLQINSS